MTTAIDIGNLALSALGTRSTIADLSEGTPESIAINQWYNTTRQQIFRMARWGFARAYTTLAVLKAAPGTPENASGVVTDQWSPANPPPPWAYEYAYPVDCLLANFIMPISTSGDVNTVPIFSAPTSSGLLMSGAPVRSLVTTDFGSDGVNRVKCICTNQRQAVLCYITDITDCNLWDQGFQQSVIYALAGSIALAVTGKRELTGDMFKLANQNIQQARQMNANESLSVQNIIPDWLKARGLSYALNGTEVFLENLSPFFAASV